MTWQRAKLTPAAAASLAAAVLAVLAGGVLNSRGVRDERYPDRCTSRSVVAARTQADQHSSGGTIVSTVLNQGITEQATLAIGDYPSLYYGKRVNAVHILCRSGPGR